MITLAHLSDLHFGTEDPAIASGLRQELLQQAPDVLIVSGDLTQRARRGQFQSAAQYLQGLPGKRLVVPGNHDIPLYDILRRFFAPLRRYRRWIDAQVNPVLEYKDLLVVGLNTARSFTWQNGRISRRQIEGLRQSLVRRQETRWRVVVTHHPFIPPPGPDHAAIDLVGRAARALPVLDEHHVDVLLAGHLHHGYSGVTQPYYPTAQRAIVAVQAGTAISRRVRRQANGYNLLRLDGDRLQIEVRTWDESRFIVAADVQYARADNTWATA